MPHGHTPRDPLMLAFKSLAPNEPRFRACLARTDKRPAAYLIALLIFLSAVLLGPAEVQAGSDDDPPIFRNARNQFTLLQPRKPAPMTIIMGEGGDLLDLGRYRGKVVLLNFWATWCAPCVRELPALDRLQSILGRQEFEIVALSIDGGGIEVPVAFAGRLRLSHLKIYLDFTGTTAEAFPLYGLPISYLIDREGIMVGYIVGAVGWDSPEAVRLVTYYMEQAGGGSGG